MEIIESYWRSLRLQAESFTTLELFYIAIGAFTCIILGLIGSMLFIMLAKSRITTRQRQLQAQFKPWLVTIVLHEPAAEQPFEVPAPISKLLKRNFNRKALLNELIRLKNNLNGQSGQNLVRLYEQLQLDRISAKAMRSSRWYFKAQGIQELATMEQKQYLQEIATFTYHRQPIVRMEAQLAMAGLQQYEGMTFFDNLLYPLTAWHQVKLLQLLAEVPVPDTDMVRSWLRSPNPGVVQFALKLIAEQHNNCFEKEVAACLSHPKEQVRQQAILCLGEIPSGSAALALRDHFISENNRLLQLAILSGLMKTGTTTELPFLEKLQHIPDEGIRIAAEKTIRHLQGQP